MPPSQEKIFPFTNRKKTNRWIKPSIENDGRFDRNKSLHENVSIDTFD